MDHYESVVIDYLRADRSLFLNTQCCIQLNDAPNPDTSGMHWYCDAVVCDMRSKAVFLVEITYSASLRSGLLKRLREWHENWPGVAAALARDSNVPTNWSIRPWLFVPRENVILLVEGLDRIRGMGELAFGDPRITALEEVQPWLYCSWNRVGEREKALQIPERYRG